MGTLTPCVSIVTLSQTAPIADIKDNIKEDCFDYLLKIKVVSKQLVVSVSKCQKTNTPTPGLHKPVNVTMMTSRNLTMYGTVFCET